jgi:hypothetical protein
VPDAQPPAHTAQHWFRRLQSRDRIEIEADGRVRICRE